MLSHVSRRGRRRGSGHSSPISLPLHERRDGNPHRGLAAWSGGHNALLTPNGTLQPLQAGIELALPQTNTASAVFRVPSSALVPVNILRIGPVTGNLLGRGGGGIEILYDGSIPIEFVTRVQ